MQDAENVTSNGCPPDGWERFGLALCAVSTVLVMGWLLRFCHYGIDFTDEGLYLVSIANPFNYDWSASQFGFVYHPLYLLLGGDIASLRQANLLITFGLAWALVSTLLKVLVPGNHSGNLPRLVVSAGFASASMMLLGVFWLPTPSYNSLALQALLVAATGLVLAESIESRSSVFGWALIGVGGWLAFMAKPTTALALGACVGLTLLVARKVRFRLLAVAVVTASMLLILSALVIDGSPLKFVERLQTGAELASYLGSGHTFRQLLRLDEFQLIEREKITLAVLAITAIFATVSTCSQHGWLKLVGALLCASLFSVVVAFTLGYTNDGVGFGQFKSLLIWSVTWAALVIGFASYRYRLFVKVPAEHWVLGLAFIAFPHVYAFGTGNNYWKAGGSAGVFWLLAGFVFVAPIARNQKSWVVFLPLALVTQVTTVLLLNPSIESPYRQPQALRLHDQAMVVGTEGSLLVLSKGYAEYLRAAVSGAKAAGFKADTPVIDLSGQSPTTLYALRAENLGQAWVVGGYPGSLKLATAALKRVSCEKIAGAWLLVEDKGSRSIPNELLASVGANVTEHYQAVASWNTAAGAGDYPYPPQRPQTLLRPTRAFGDAVRVCNDKRRGT